MAPPGVTLDARALVDVMGRFADALRAHREELDSLNVFPVPDGDTGTNLLMTQEAVVRALDGVAEEPSAVAEAVTRASLMGARGNSGVILSQVLRGLLRVLAGAGTDGSADGPRLSEALAEAAREARRAVAQPRPGTVLTVLDAAAVAAREAASGGGDTAEVAAAAERAAAEALEATPDQLPELKRAGVVDAGGKGALLLLDALHAVCAGTALEVAIGPLGPVGRETGLDETSAAPEFAFEVMYLLESPDEAIAGLRDALSAIGDSVVVVGGGGLSNVHVHTNAPDAAVEAGRLLGEPREVRVTDLREAVLEQCLAGQARAVQVAEQRVGLVAVAEGEGLADLFRSLGAVVVSGGPGRNPSVAEIHAAIEITGLGSVVVLPNQSNVLPAAGEAASAASEDRDVTVIPTRSMPEGLAAAAAFNPLGDPDEVAADMAGAASGCSAGAVAVAAKDAESAAGPVRAGQWLAIAGDDVIAAGDDVSDVAMQLVRHLRRDGQELLTLVTGEDAPPADAVRVREAVEAAADGLEVEVHDGGQPRHPYLIGIE